MSFVPTQAELALVNQILAVADTDKLNLVTGKQAVKVFEGAKLQPHVLGEIWSLSDKENNGFLTRSGLATAVRLIGHAQQGETMNADLLDRPATTLAHIEGISKPTSRVSSIPSSPTPRSPAPRGAPLPPLTQEDKAKFARLFESCGPVQGLISGEKARGTFVKSNLPIDKLGSIWALADSQNRGALDQTDFTIAMYLIQASMSGKLPVIPNTLPPGFYEQAGGRPSRGILAQNTGNSASLSPSLTGNFAPTAGGSRYSMAPIAAQTTGSMQPLQPQGTGQQYNAGRQAQVHFSPQNTGSVLGASAFGHVAPPPPAPQWDVTAEEKARFDKFFEGLDTQRRGFIEADVAVPFMLQSQLSQEVLAPIWDLADLNNDGCLTPDGFAIAMHLIQAKLAGKEVPATMPESLIPPSMRKGKGLSIMPPPPPEPVRDLLGDDTPPASPPVSYRPPVTTAPRSNIQTQQTGSLSPQSTGLANRSPLPPSDPFSAAFGPPPPASVVRRDLLSDDDDTAASTPPVPDNSVEIGNLQNQLQSTNRSLESTKADRERTEQAISTQASQLSSLQTQLASAKAAYETETRLLNALRERFASQASEMQKLREELIRAESDLSGIRVEKSEIEGNLLRDKEDHRELQRKMKEAGEETERLKTVVEKAKKDTKHQKGLLAIAKKQLVSREADRAKAAKELEEAEQEASETVSELQEAEAQLAKEPEPLQVNGSARAMSPVSRMDTPSFAASMPLPTSPSPPGSILSPASTKSNNPFERLAMGSGASTPRPASPFAVSTDVTGTQDAFSPFATSPAENTTWDVPRAASPFMHASDESKPAKPPSEVPRAASPFMHVAEASTTTAASGESAEDPFGFGDGDGDEKSTDSTGVSTPDKPANAQRVDHSTESPISPNDSFQTATMSPSSSTPAPKPEERKDTTDTIVHAAAAHFPSLDEPDSSSGGGLIDNAPDSPEMSSRALEIEHEESDSDSEDEEENKPLSSLVKKEDNTPKERSISPAKDLTTPIAGPIPSDTRQAEPGALTTSPAPTAELFDDAFGIKSPDNKSASTANGFDDAFGPKPTTAESATVPPQAKTSTDLLNDFFTSMSPQQSGNQDANNVTSANVSVSGVNAFDEAMNGITPAGSAVQPQFKLDSSFEDNFDFAAAAKANESPFTAPPVQPSAVNGFAATTSANTFDNAFLPSVQTTGDQKSPSNASNAFAATQPLPDKQASLNDSQTSNKAPTFDDAFGSLSSKTSTVASSTGQAKTPTFNDAFGSLSSRVSSVPSSADHGISFDDVFGGGTAPALGDTLGLPAQTAPEVKKQDTAPQPAPFPSSPPGSPSSRMPASRSSVRSTSPPPRISSPRPRPSTGSSSDGGVPPSKPPPAQRHSKLSIRLPFGRKDKKKSKNEPPPPSLLGQSSTFLSPVAEPERNVTPAVEDDVEPVKQLCGMGFSRSQAVTALESNGYNFQKALDSLLRATPA